jgi:HEAT repeat protein
LQELLSDADEYSYSISAGLMGSRPVKYEAVLALGKIGSRARICLPEVRRMFAIDSDPSVRLAAAVAMAQLDKEDTLAIRYLENEAERSSSEDLRSDAIQGIKQLGRRASTSTPVLRRVLRSDGSWLVRAHCAEALPAVNGFGKDTVDALVEALDDREPWVQMTALESLETMGSRAVNAIPFVESLLDMYTSLPEDDLPYLNGDIRVQAVTTLLAIGNREGVLPIINRILPRVKSEEPRSRIQELLRRRAEPTDSEPNTSIDGPGGTDGTR